MFPPITRPAVHGCGATSLRIDRSSTKTWRCFSTGPTDRAPRCRRFDVPTLVLHGEDDQIVPVKDSAKKSARLIAGATEIFYPGAPHGLTATHQDQVNRDLLAFLRS